MAGIVFALALNLHQPSGNLEQLLANEEWEAKEILWAMDLIDGKAVRLVKGDFERKTVYSDRPSEKIAEMEKAGMR